MPFNSSEETEIVDAIFLIPTKVKYATERHEQLQVIKDIRAIVERLITYDDGPPDAASKVGAYMAVAARFLEYARDYFQKPLEDDQPPTPTDEPDPQLDEMP